MSDEAARHSDPPSPAIAAFDWPAIVEQTRPGKDTPLQRAQAARLRQALSDLRKWATQTNLLIGRVEPAAAFAVVSTSATTPATLTNALARLFLWVFSVDTWLDEQPDERLDDPVWIDETLYACVHALSVYRKSARTPPASSSPVATENGRPAQLSAAAHDWLEAAIASWLESAPDVTDAWARIVAEQTINVVAFMRQEFAWSAAYRAWRHGQRDVNLPALDEYLAVATRTVGVHPAAALVCAGTNTPLDVWEHAQPTLTCAARVIRLANDHSTRTEDAARETLTAATLLDYEESITNNQTASPTLRATLDQEIIAFAEGLSALDHTPLAGFLRQVVAHALAYYLR